MNASRRVQAIAIAVAVLLVGAIAWVVVSVSDSGPSAEQAPGQRSEKGKQIQDEPATWPLTGLPVRGKGDGTQPFPAYAVKVDNTSSSAPQRGLGQADLVVEELVEGGTTRLAAFFHSQLPKVVGPVRSMRATDVGVVSPARATVVTSGAAGPTIRRIEQAGIVFLGESNASVYRDGARAAPYNVFANLQGIAQKARKDHPNPDDYFTWGKAKDLPKGRKASGLSAAFGRQTTTWRFEQGRYRNETGYAASGDEFVADTVVVMRVQVGDAGYRDPAGSFVPESKLTGSGPMSIFHGGRQVSGTWQKKSLDAPPVLRSGGKEVPVPAGHTWVELVPVSGNVSVR